MMPQRRARPALLGRGWTVGSMIVEDTPNSNLLQTGDTGLPDAGYAEVLADIKTRVDAARVRALRAANAELMGVYWHIGRHIAEQQDAAPVKRGPTAPKIIERLSADLRAAYPDATGFSPRNLTYMRDFSRAWTEESILQRGVARLPWGRTRPPPAPSFARRRSTSSVRAGRPSSAPRPQAARCSPNAQLRRRP